MSIRPHRPAEQRRKPRGAQRLFLEQSCRAGSTKRTAGTRYCGGARGDPAPAGGWDRTREAREWYFDLHGTDLRGTILADTDLAGAILTGADLSGANLNGANLNGANRHIRTSRVRNCRTKRRLARVPGLPVWCGSLVALSNNALRSRSSLGNLPPVNSPALSNRTQRNGAIAYWGYLPTVLQYRSQIGQIANPDLSQRIYNMISLPTIHSIIKTVRDVLSIFAVPRWLLFSVVSFGVAAALTDGLSTSIIILLLYSLMDHTSEIFSTNVFISELVSWITPGAYNHLVLMLLLVCLLLSNMGFTFCYTMINAKIRHRVIETVRNRINSQFLEVSYDFILRHDRGHLLNMWANDSWSMGDVYLFSGRILVNLCASVVFFLLLLAISAKLLVISLIGTTVLFIGMHRFAKPARDLGRQMRKRHEQITERMLVTLQGMRALRVFGEEARYQKGFEIASARIRQTCITFERLHALVSPAVHVGYLLLLVAIVFIGRPMGVTFVATLAFVALLYRFQPYVRELRSNLLLIAQLQTSVASVMGILDRSDKIYIRSGSSSFCGLKDEIRFERVSFTYAGAPAPSLDCVSFAIPAGSVTAFVGMSGAGKTTIVNLLLGLYRPNAGLILVDGIPLDELSRTNWLSKVASAGQDVELVEGTIGDNLRLAQPNADVSAMREAADAVNMLETIENLSDGFDSWIGQQGLKLSGGQRQRLGLARALLRDPEILVLDEATNSLNSALENEIWASIRRRLTGRTFVLITHRPETAMTADQVICIDSGRVIEVVSRAELQANPQSVCWTLLRDAVDSRQSQSPLSQAED